MTSVDIDHLLQLDEVRQLLDGAEQAGSLRAAELADLVELHELDALEQDALVHELEQRGIDVIDGQPPEPAPDPVPAVTVAVSPETTTDALQLFLREAGRHELLTAAEEVAPAQRSRSRGKAGEQQK